MDKITLSTEQLEVTVALPGTKYKGSRYDWSGHITQVRLNVHHTFFSTLDAPPDVSLGGSGLLDVFESPDNLGYDETDLGNRFPMIGIGLLKKDSKEPFLFRNPYNVLPFEHSIQRATNSVTFTTLPFLCNGYAVLEEKSLLVEGTTLTNQITLKNTGTKTIELSSFNHNFFQFDDCDINGDYILTLPYNQLLSVRRGEISSCYNSIRIANFDEPTASCAFLLYGFEGMSSHWWKLSNIKLGINVLCQEDFPLTRFYLWTIAHSFSPETSCKIVLAPGESYTFTRKYTFSEE